MNPSPDRSGSHRDESSSSSQDSQNELDLSLHESVSLELGDFLSRIPQPLLTPGPHNPQIPLHFLVDEIGDRVARGESTIPLSEIYKRVPHIFREAVVPPNDPDIRFPWERILTLVHETASGAGEMRKPAGDALAARVEGISQPSKSAPATEKKSSVQPHSMEPPLSIEEMLRQRNEALDQLAHLRADYDRKIVALQKEREQAIKQRDRLQTQLDELRKIPDPLSGPAGGVRSAAFDRRISQREHQRQVDELNRRILALESAQKDRTQEFSREREARLKVERQLAAAERALQESAHHLETLRGGAGDAQFAEITELDAADASHPDVTRLVADRDAALAKVRELEHRLAMAESADEGAEKSWERRAIEQLEADIEVYRNRITELLRERGSHPSSVPATTTALPPASADQADLQNQNETLFNANATLRSRVKALEEQLAASQTASAPVAETHRTAEGMEDLVRQRDEAVALHAQVRGELESIQLQRRHEAEKFERERLVTQQTSERTTSMLRKAIDSQQRAVSSLTREREELARANEQLTSELQHIRREHDQLSSQMSAPVQAETLPSVTETVPAMERDALCARIETLEKELRDRVGSAEELRKQLEERQLRWDEVRASLVTQLDELRKRERPVPLRSDVDAPSRSSIVEVSIDEVTAPPQRRRSRASQSAGHSAAVPIPAAVEGVIPRPQIRPVPITPPQVQPRE